MKDLPLVSILMTAYNREKYIAEAVESVLASTYTNWELIIVDDRSADNTLQIVNGYAAANSRIKVYKNEKNLGDYANRNKAASYATGEYIAIVDSDDWMIKDSLQKWVTAMQQFDSASFGIFSEVGGSTPYMLSSEVAIRRHFFERAILNFGPIATIVKNEFFKAIGGFPVKYIVTNDMYYNLKAAAASPVVIFPFPLVNYRKHEGQELHKKYSFLHLYNNYLYLRDALNELSLPLLKEEKVQLIKKNKRRFFVNALKFLLGTRDIKKTREAIRLAEFKLKDAVAAIF